jgi:hypothetical protein
MPLAALFIGRVLPALLCSLIRKRAGYMKYNLGLKNKIQPQVEATSYKLQATSYKQQAKIKLDIGSGII